MSIEIKTNDLKDYENIVNRFKEKSENPNRSEDKGFVNEDNQSSLLIKKDGSINIASNGTTTNKLTQDKILETGISKELIVNRLNLSLDEITINNQKLNPQLVELSDSKVLFDSNVDAIGNLTINGCVLVKAWETNLKKYVLIRRKIRTPLFSAQLNLIDSPELMDTATNVVQQLDLNAANLLKQEKIIKEKGTGEEIAATGGSIYNQGDYNNYLTDFIASAQSFVSYNNNSVNNNQDSKTNNDYTTEEDVYVDNVAGLDFVWPVPESNRITSKYGPRNGGFHNGLDIGRNYELGENTKICACADGEVEAIRTLTGESLPPYTGYGKCVIIKHPNGMKTIYAHLSAVKVKIGMQIKQGQWIGNMGQTGNAYGIHLHLGFCGTYNGVTKEDFSIGFNPEIFVKPQN